MFELKLNVKGMMCGGCENRIKNSVSTIDGVKEVTANHTTGEVIVKASKEIDSKEVESLIEDIGYEIVK